MSGSRKAHWQRVYDEKEPTEVSWYQSVPAKSLQLIGTTGIAHDDAILDVGGGASTLVDNLLDEGFTDISVLDLSGNALERSRGRLGEASRKICWIESDVVDFHASRRYALWHDRAVLHFLTDTAERDRYIDVMYQSLLPNGHVVLATFGPQGPKRCSGLEIQRYGIEQLEKLFGSRFELHDYELDEHKTPMGSTQQFLYSRWQSRS